VSTGVIALKKGRSYVGVVRHARITAKHVSKAMKVMKKKLMAVMVE